LRGVSVANLHDVARLAGVSTKKESHALDGSRRLGAVLGLPGVTRPVATLTS
jgi:hypothetical protein